MTKGLEFPKNYNYNVLLNYDKSTTFSSIIANYALFHITSF